jgi:D-alanyl-lipoteichoic acid acyltransferase DltB (MBOAT superfamily)
MLCVVMLNVVILNVITFNGVVLSVVMLNGANLSVIFKWCYAECWTKDKRSSLFDMRVSDEEKRF